MDEEWKKQNQVPDGSSGTTDGQASSPPPAAAPGASFSPTANPGQTVTPQDNSRPQPLNSQITASIAYEQQPSPPASSKKKLIIIVAVILLLFIALGAYLVFAKKDKGPGAADSAGQSQTTAENTGIVVPGDWQTVNTGLGFSVKAPNDWTSSQVANNEINGFKVRAMTFSSKDGSSSNNLSANSMIAGVETFTGSTSQADFEAAVADVDRTAEGLKDFDIDKSQINITSSKITINGKEWTQVDTSLPGQFTRTLYLWANDHEVFLTVFADTQDSANVLVTPYLLPMAASVEVQ